MVKVLKHRTSIIIQLSSQIRCTLVLTFQTNSHAYTIYANIQSFIESIVERVIDDTSPFENSLEISGTYQSFMPF